MMVKLMPVLIIPLLHQIRLLKTVDLYLCIAFLFLSPLFLTLFSINSVTLPFSTSSRLSALLVCLIRNQSLALINMSNLRFFFVCFFPHWYSSFFFFFWEGFSHPFLFWPLHTEHVPPVNICGLTWNVWHPLLQRRHHRRGAAASAGGGGVPPRWVCQCLLPRLAGAAESRWDLDTHSGLRALRHR